MVQLREKDLPRGPSTKKGCASATCCGLAGCRYHQRRIDIALALDADGVHVGRTTCLWLSQGGFLGRNALSVCL